MMNEPNSQDMADAVNDARLLATALENRLRHWRLKGDYDFTDYEHRKLYELFFAMQIEIENTTDKLSSKHRKRK